MFNSFKGVKPVHIVNSNQHIMVDNKKVRYFNDYGDYHRVDGPSIIQTSGNEEWYFNNRLHRVGGPAIVNSDGSEEYWVNGQFSRVDGPAVIRFDGHEEYWVNGYRQTGDYSYDENE